ncbi:hypothetical protein ATHSA_1227 [Athalassotoga saccharophila]|nr:hypothetical protein ATHSA_1227 [Athalassotoga saccharophila]
MKIHHVGYAVDSIEEGIKTFEALGFKVDSDTFNDVKRKVEIVFMSKGEMKIELVAPLSVDSPVSKFLSKNGPSPYHICYSTDDIYKTVDKLKQFKFIQISEIEEALAISNKKVVFMYSKPIGILELVEGA